MRPGCRGGRAQDLLLVGHQPFTDHDGLCRAVAKVVQEPGCPPTKPNHVGSRESSGGQVADDSNRAVICSTRSRTAAGPHAHARLVWRPARQAVARPPRRRLSRRCEGQVLPDHPPVRTDSGPVQGEGQQRRPGQPGQRPVQNFRSELLMTGLQDPDAAAARCCGRGDAGMRTTSYLLGGKLDVQGVPAGARAAAAAPQGCAAT